MSGEPPLTSVAHAAGEAGADTDPCRPDAPPRLELWAGVECSVVRVGERYVDQLERTGHAGRPHDIERIVELGVRTVRYPVLWERTAPDSIDRPDWRWTDERLGRLRAYGLRPIAGLLHHGSGPRYTNLLDPGFPRALARYAEQVARRYPWLDAYTPINEPLTTARFSALYGHWYPHARDDRRFVGALLAQCRGVALAMRAVRAVNSSALLVQTEDLGHVSSTRRLGYQADFENERRWLTWDLLAGRVDRSHPLRGWLEGSGADPAALDWFVEHRTPADILGINHYVTSNRFLDHRLARYPPDVQGGNGREEYADVAAVRVRGVDAPGPGRLLREAGDRYGAQIAITEAHIACTREEQLRWYRRIWTEALDAARDGVPVRAVTAWSLFGAYDWDSLLTNEGGTYEPGAFDVRGGAPRSTATARLLRALAAGRPAEDPGLSGQSGWWARPGRFLHDSERPAPAVRARGVRGSAPPPLLIAGGDGTLGRAFGRLARQRGLEHTRLPRRELDVADAGQVARVLERLRPWAVVNAAGYVRVADAERDVERCWHENVTGAEVLAAACAARGVRLVTFSSDLVFGGGAPAAPGPYLEDDQPAPTCVYGRAKAEAELRVRASCPDALVVRTSAFFGPWDPHNFVARTLRALEAGRPWRCPHDCVVSPTYVPDLVHAVLDLLVDGERGLWHLANRGATSWAELAREVAVRAGHPPELVIPCSTASLGLAAPRPSFTALGSARAALLPTLAQGLDRYFADRTAGPSPVASARVTGRAAHATPIAVTPEPAS